MNSPEALNPFPAENVLASGPFVVEVLLGDEPVQSVGFDLQQEGQVLEWWSEDHVHSQPLKGATHSVGDELKFTREDGVEFLLRPFVPGDGHLLHFEDDDYLEQEPEQGRAALLQAVHDAWLEERDAPVAPEADPTNLVLGLDAEGQPMGLFRLSGSSFPLQRVDGAWKRISPDVEDDLFGASDVDVRATAVQAWDQGQLDVVLAARTDAYATSSPFERIYASVNTSEEADETSVAGLYAERSRGRLYVRQDGQWTAISRASVPVSSTVDVTTGAIGAWDDDELTTLSEVEQYDRDGDTP